jgi:protein phosphatase
MSKSGELDTGEYMALVDQSQALPPAGLSAAVRVDLGSMTHPGKVRPNNEDHFLAVRFGRSLETLRTNLAEGLVPATFAEVGYGFVVADGMGGAAAGEVASSLAISVGLNLALNSPKWNLHITPDEIRENMEKWRHRFRQIDFILTERAEADPKLAGMGTTLTVACSVGKDLVIYHVGDSRAYLFRNNRLIRLTRDHTLAQDMADAGMIAPQEVEHHRLRHALTRVVGRSGGAVEAELQHLRLSDGDRLLVCTDGLTEMVPDADIAGVLAQVEGSEDACRVLLRRALDAGGNDNITVVLARYSIPAAPAE